MIRRERRRGKRQGKRWLPLKKKGQKDGTREFRGQRCSGPGRSRFDFGNTRFWDFLYIFGNDISINFKVISATKKNEIRDDRESL